MALTCSFLGKRILVTGGATGIGRAIVDKLVADKASVTVIDRKKEALASLKKDLPSVSTHECDVGNWKEARALVQSVGPVDHLVNNAGVITFAPLLQIQEEDVDHIFNINLKSVINISQVVAAAMIEKKIPGSIVNVSSMSSQLASGGMLLYGGTKGAVNNVTKTMALELGRFGIRVNAICPAFVDTDMTRSTNMGDKVQYILKRAAIRRLVKPEEVADLTLFLLSSNSAMITGQSVFIDGGFTTN
jgi:L-xylulose reductase